MITRSELALPAGNLQCALYAFKGGADAVYLGMKLFSARAGAVNFSFEDLRKLKKVCLEQNKKFYITLNTLVKDSDLNEVYHLLRQLEYIHPDGIIVQDLGIVNIIRRDFPSLSLHGSTQLAVHSVKGVQELKDLGFSRVVLSRELSFEEIKEIREKCPDIELKVFIHGALCYGFSGLCMASQQITGRSANCGSCAQICRTWFTCKETDEDAWFFSMKDLCLGQLVKKYQDIGIDSLKVEGRMKGPEYVYWTAKYYSQILDGLTEEDEQVRWAKQAMQIAFSRSTTKGFFDTGKNGSINCETMVSTDYPSHRGIEVGIIQKVLNNKAIIQATQPIAIRDGLQVTFNNETQGFALSYIDCSKSFIAEGEKATINFPSEKFSKKPEYGTKLMCTSRHNGNLSLISENISLYKKPVDITLNIQNDALEINNERFPLEIQEAKKEQDIKQIIQSVFSSSDKSYFTLGNLSIKNSSNVKNPFLPLSILKQIRRDFYEKLDRDFEEYLEKEQNIHVLPREKYTIDQNATRLNPIMFNEKKFFEDLEKQNPSIVGINNIAQVKWLKEHPQTRCFADVFMYAKNSEALALLKQELPNIEGFVSEDEDKVPIFISRVCFRHNSLGLDCKNCSKDNTYHISQNEKNYLVKCKNCITTVIQQ